MNPATVLNRARQILPLNWQIDPNATDPAVVSADHGTLTVGIGLTTPLVIVGTFGEEDFFEAETDDLEGALVELAAQFQRLAAMSPWWDASN